MTNRKSSVRDGIQKSIRNMTGRLRAKRRRSERRLLTETLESRQLLAGPELIGIQSDVATTEGSLFNDFETLRTDSLPLGNVVLSQSPNELTFRFDDNANIDPESLAGITITRAGADGYFEAASAVNDLGTGTELLEYRATSSGLSGNGTTILYRQQNRGNTGTPVTATVDTSGAAPIITLSLNSASGRPATLGDVVGFINNTASVNRYITVQQLSPASATAVGTTVDTTRSVVLQGANASQAVTDLGTGGSVSVRLVAAQTGATGTGTTVVVTPQDFNGPGLPRVLVSGKTVSITVNSNATFATTVDQFIAAINSNSLASELVTASLQIGSGSTLMGNRTVFYSPLVLSGASDEVLTPGYVGLGESNREIVFRFAEALPDDTYRIDISASGTLGLRNEDGEYFNDGTSVTGQFVVDGGPKILAVVPQPVTRNTDGTLAVASNVVEVHVDGGDIDQATLTNRNYYRLIYTRDTLTTRDDYELLPSAVTYNPITKIVRLEFANALSRVADPLNPGQFIDGAARLRIGSSEPINIAPKELSFQTDAPDSFSDAFNLNSQWAISSNPNAGIQLAQISGEISNTSAYELELPGGSDVPGIRDIRPDDPSRLERTIPLDVLRLGADNEAGITEFQYDFVDNWQGDDPNKPGIDESKTYFNLITEQQKARVREVLSLFSEYLGVQFIETSGGLTSQASFSIAVGELYGADASVNSAAALRDADGNAILNTPEAIVLATRDRNLDGVDDLAVLDFQDFDPSTIDQIGGEFFRGAFLAVGQLLGYGYADSLPQPVTQSTASVLNPGTDNEPAFPSVADIVNGQYMYRPESNDIDLYSFTLDQQGTISIETLAERLPTSSLLNTALRLYAVDGDGYVEIAANDDYFSNDSLIELELEAGTYAIGVSASGNTTYDPTTAGSGYGGLSEGTYQLNLGFRASAADAIRDTAGNAIDGDLDGTPGGLFNFWFVPNDPNTTLYVDKAATNPDLNRATSNPYLNIDDAIRDARPGDTIRIVGNGGTDGDLSTVADNLAYEIGLDNRGIALADGESLVAPQGVNIVVDAGAVFKMRRSRVGIGSTSPQVDLSNSSLQILGTPTIIDSFGRPALDDDGNEIPGSVIFTSYNDDLDPDQPDSAREGDWGGIDFRGDIDSADESRVNLEDQGIFLNHIQFADLRYGGGQVSINGPQVAISPIDMAVTRPTIINSSIRLSANSAMSATPDTFAESRFTQEQLSGVDFTPDISRVGPHIRGNTIADNSINGLFIRVATRTGSVLQPLTETARFDDTDIVHVLTENLVIQGTAGGPIQSIDAPSSLLIRVSDSDTAGIPLEGEVLSGSYQYRVTFVDSSGRESDPSLATATFDLEEDGAMRLTGLPTVPAGSLFSARRLYRATVAADGTVGEFRLVGSLNASQTSYIDAAVAGTDSLPEAAQNITARLNPGLTIDPGTVLKMNRARIDVTLGAHFYAEGTEQRPVVMTSLSDDRYGTGGTFDSDDTANSELTAGDWAGLYIGYGATASIDHAVIAGGGGTATIQGGFASFNAIEVHQADLRLANSRLEQNADGRGFYNTNLPDRAGHGDNESGTVFVLASQPVIVNNDFIDGLGPMASFDVNSFSFNEVTDYGRSTYTSMSYSDNDDSDPISSVSSIGNSGPLVQDNRISGIVDESDDDDDDDDEDDDDDIVAATFGLNGMEVRAGQVTTEVVFDDVDIVHIVRGSIEVPNQYIYGGLRLESDARGSLVMKFEGSDAGIVAGGTLATAEDQFVDIADRIGGSLQIVGHPDFPVVLTALVDDTIGAGFTPEGLPALDTNNDGIRTSILTSETAGEATPAGLPVGPQYDRTDIEVDNGTTIDNDIDQNVVGFFEATVESGSAVTDILVTGIDQATATQLDQQNYAFLATTIVDIDLDSGFANPAPFTLAETTITRPATLVSPDRVVSEGLFTDLSEEEDGERQFQWIASTFILDNRSMMYTTIDIISVDGRDINAGAVRSIQVTSYFTHGAGAGGQDTLYSVGDPGEFNFRAYTIDGQDRLGFSHGGIYEDDGYNQLNATFDGWAADNADQLLTTINAENNTPSVSGSIGTGLPEITTDPLFPNANAAYGVDDIGTAFTWSLVANEDRARFTSFIEWIPSDPADPFVPELPINIDGSGSWDGVTIREAADDRNVASTSENEPNNVGSSDTNPTPGRSQYLGELAPNESSGDENRRLGFIVDGSISSTGDVDVYSFIGEAGTLVWLDIDRTDLKLDTVIELIDANGNTLVLSDDSLAESIGTKSRLTSSDGRFDANNAGSLNRLVNDDPSLTTADHQDLYSVNPKDAGMRLVLPGEAGQRNLYHIRVRSSSVASGANGSLVVSGQVQSEQLSSLRRGLTSGGYQLQVRLSETDEHAGTQVRFSDIRYAVNGVQIIGGPLHSPLAGDEYEVEAPNDTLGNAQIIGLYSTTVDNAGTGVDTGTDDEDIDDEDIDDEDIDDEDIDDEDIDDEDIDDEDIDDEDIDDEDIDDEDIDDEDIDDEDIDDEDADDEDAGDDAAAAGDTLTAAGPLQSDRLSKSIGGSLSGIDDVDWYQFDVNYTNLTRDNAALYLATAFDLDYSDGLARADTGIYVFNEAGELILIGSDSNIADDQPIGSADASDLSRGSFGSGDPYIGASELAEGTYFIAVANQQRIPAQLDQFTNRDTTNPLLRLEPIDSVTRIVEQNFDNFYPGTATLPDVEVLFDQDSIIDYTFDDVLLYVNTGTSLIIVNPFTGVQYGTVGNFGDEIRDIAFQANGELFAYTGFDDRAPADDAWSYVRINTEDATLSDAISVGAGIVTYHDQAVEQDAGGDAGPVILQQILDVESNDGIEVEAITIRSLFGTETGFFVGNRPQDRQGLAYTTNILYQFNEDTGEAVGTTFDLSLEDAGSGTAPREIGQINTEAPVGARSTQLGFTDATEINAFGLNAPSIVDGDRFTITNTVETVTFEFDQGYTVVVGDAGNVLIGDRVSISMPGESAQTFEFVTDAANVTVGNIPVVIDATLGAEALAGRLADAIRSEGISISAEGTQMSLPDAENVTVLADMTSSLVLQGTPGVEDDNYAITLYPTDTSATIANRIVAAVEQANASGDLPDIQAIVPTGSANARSVLITGGFLGDIANSQASQPTGNLTAGGVPNGGLITGIELVDGNLYAVSNTGGLYVVGSGFLGAGTGNNNTIANYVTTATDLIGINFTGLRAGPASVQDGELSQTLFGITADGTIYAFNTQGELQPVFAGGRSSIRTNVSGSLGLDFSTLDYNLWHVTSTEPSTTGEGHGTNAIHSGTRDDYSGGNSLAFNYENAAFAGNYAPGEVPVQLGVNSNPRQDGQGVDGTYNFPGGAKGVIESNAIDLSGVSSKDLPTLYFSYFLENDGFDDDDTTVGLFGDDRDSLRVYVIDQYGVEHLVATNNEGRGESSFDDEFDDPAELGIYDDDIDTEVQQLFDNADGNWRQARVPLGAFAGQSGLRLRVEFASAGTTQTTTNVLQAVSAEQLVENEQMVINGEVFSIDFAPAVSTPSGRNLAKAYAADSAAVAVITVDGQDYVLNDGQRPVADGQISVDLLASQPAGTTLDTLSAAAIASLVADTIDMTRLVPTGIELAVQYSDPDALYVIEYSGQEYALNDGTRVIGIEQVPVDLTTFNQPIFTLTKTQIAESLRIAAGVAEAQFNVAENVNFSDASDAAGVTTGRNDVLFSATQLPYSGGNSTIFGNGRFGSFDSGGNLTNLNDVDMLRAEVTAGTTITVDVDLTTNPLIGANVRFFDSAGYELDSVTDVVNGTVQITATSNDAVYIGLSGFGNETYDPNIADSGTVGQTDAYTATVKFTLPIGVVTDGNLIEIAGASSIATSSDTLLPTSGQETLDGNSIRISRSANADEVATAMGTAIADRFTGGDPSMVPVSGSSIRIAGLTIDDFGPFFNANDRYGDLFGAGGISGGIENDFRGAFLDDFIIGFAERGELVTDANPIGANEAFVPNGSVNLTSPVQPTQPTVTGSYQLEIRDASEYVDSAAAATFRTFATNDRLTSGYTLTAMPGSMVVDGATFTVSGLGSPLTFEFDIFDAFGVSDGLNSGTSQTAIRISESATANEVANAVLNALRSSTVSQIVDISATGANGNLGFQQSQPDTIALMGDSRVNVYGDVIITANDGAFAEVELFDLRGDENRDRSDQGVIIIENSRFVFNSDAGIDLNRSSGTSVTGVDETDLSASAIVYPRNLVVLNSENLLPGVVVQSNVLAFNANAGIRMTGLGDAGGTQRDPIWFDRIVNNTIVGGNVNEAAESFPDVYNDTVFDHGEISFADSVISFTAGANVTPGFDDPTRALGVPDAGGSGVEPTDGEFTTSLGRRGTITVAFTDNYLTGSGDARPDLIVFETGSIEGVMVEVSRDGSTFINVGIIGGIDSTIDLDSAGFGAHDRFGFVRLTDLAQGTLTTGAVGADIDAVGALSTVAADIYIPGSQGVVVQDGAAPTILNNVIANTQTGLAVDDASSKTVIGGTSYYRNATNASNNQVQENGFDAQLIPSAQEVFIDPVQLVFTPRASTPVIDSSIDSLEDRQSLISVKGAIGLSPSPIIAPRFDVNGQLRVDDPSVDTSTGSGESVFKDRGAEDRADQVGPRAVLVTPRAPDIGIDGGLAVTAIGDIYTSFDIQLIDGIAPADPTPGVGIDDSSVTGDAILVTRDGETLVEGEDYRFGYDPSNNVIRLTPLAGVWMSDSVYVIRLLDSSDAVLRVSEGSTYSDGGLTTVIGLDNSFTTLETDTGISIVVSPDLFGEDIEGQSIEIFDGSRTVTFELITEGEVFGDTVGVLVPETFNVEQITTALSDAINNAGLNVTANSLDNRIQLLGSSTLTTAVPLTDAFTVTVTTTDILMSSDLVGLADGETVLISDGVDSVTFEFDDDGVQLIADSTLVPVLITDSTRQLAEALNTAIATTTLNVTATTTDNRVTLLADSPFAIATASSEAIRIVTTIDGPTIGTSVGFGIRVPNDGAALDASVVDGQTFTIQAGADLVKTFELDFGGGVVNSGATPVVISARTLDAVVLGLNNAIGGAGLGLNPEDAGDGRITLGGNANYSLDLSGSTLIQIASPGQNKNVPVVIPIDATTAEVAELYKAAIDSIPLADTTVEIVGDRLVIDGIATITGTGALIQPIISDDVGNQMQSNNDGGTTELVIFVGGSSDYADAPGSNYQSDATAHNIIDNLYLGRGVTPDTEAKLSNADRLDDGVRFTSAIQPGFSTNLSVDINLPADSSDNVGIAAPGVFYLDAWFDWNQDGIFAANEAYQFGSNGSGRLEVGVGAGNSISIAVPNTALSGTTYARFRISEDATIDSTGFATSGEVEDYSIYVGNNPYRNPTNRNDVNNSGEVTPLDALQIINALGRAGSASINLSQTPLPADLPLFPDTNGDGLITASDALNVINYLNDTRNTFEGEMAGQGEQIAPQSTASSSRYVPMGEGVFASGATAYGDLLIEEASKSTKTNAVESSEPMAELSQGQNPSQSVFDSSAVMSVDSVVDLIAEDTASTKEDEDAVSVLDRLFAGLEQ
ncbi:hypothetical protein Q31b_25000 [Novipirellula aureliae]|uniref:Uncharacterized protein n=1 Tax=Novipirellula aureliae TaxID=2527966 RepID=A0A5C6E8B3_9BACT|nr:GEVED domain-containing protein [Novipirellula aureliae]TWU43459.1 hypothetical protein Q31b_25000 [Novipirellula aureliae]